ncbi:MAG: SpoIIE family protein phosphatase, partial [Thermoanaerobaculales bacterium]|nr:SpoIIE family protein phosphatase [Thermoanaerobaculales bacterium]
MSLRWRRAAVLMAPGILAFLLASLSVVDMFLPRPYDGVVLESDSLERTKVRDVVPGSGAARAGIRPGDVIVGIDRELLKGASSAQVMINRHEIGDVIPYFIRTGGAGEPAGHLVEIEVELGRRRIGDTSYLYAVLLGFAFFGVGAFVLLRQSRLPVSRVFFNMCALFLLFLVCRLRPASYSWLDTLVLSTGTMALLLLPAVFLHFFLIFPRPIWEWRRDPIANAIGWIARFSSKLLPLYALPPLVYAITVFLARRSGGELALISGAPMTNWWTMAAYMALGLGALGVAAARLPDVRERRGAGIVFVGAVFGVVPFVVLAVGFPSFFHTERFIFYGVVPLILVPLTFAYAIVRFQMLNIRVILRKSLLYTITTALVTAVYALAIAFSTRFFQGTAVADSPYFPILFALAIVLLFEPLRQRLQGPVDGFFFAERHRLQRAMVEMGEKMTDEVELGPVVGQLVERLPELLRLRFAALYLVREGHMQRVAGPLGLPAELALLPILYRHLKRHGSLLRLSEFAPLRLLSLEVDRLAVKLSEAGVESVGLLATTRRTVGLILLSETSGQTVLEREEEDLLRSLFHQASLVLETSLLLDERTRQAELERELKIASAIQASLLPDRLGDVSGWERVAVCVPAREVGGDFITELPCSEGKGGALAYGDVAGKSISGALMMMASHEILNAVALGNPKAEDLLNLANKRLYDMRDRSREMQAGRFVALGYLGFPENGGHLNYALAGQPPPMVVCPSGDVETVKLPEHRVPLGALSFGGHQLLTWKLEPGSVVVAYSDGVIEAQDPEGELFGEDRLRALLSECAGWSAKRVMDEVVDAVDRFSEGATPYDDLTLVVA